MKEAVRREAIPRAPSGCFHFSRVKFFKSETSGRALRLPTLWLENAWFRVALYSDGDDVSARRLLPAPQKEHRPPAVLAGILTRTGVEVQDPFRAPEEIQPVSQKEVDRWLEANGLVFVNHAARWLACSQSSAVELDDLIQEGIVGLVSRSLPRQARRRNGFISQKEMRRDVRTAMVWFCEKEHRLGGSRRSVEVVACDPSPEDGAPSILDLADISTRFFYSAGHRSYGSKYRLAVWIDLLESQGKNWAQATRNGPQCLVCWAWVRPCSACSRRGVLVFPELRYRTRMDRIDYLINGLGHSSREAARLIGVGQSTIQRDLKKIRKERAVHFPGIVTSIRCKEKEHFTVNLS